MKTYLTILACFVVIAILFCNGCQPADEKVDAAQAPAIEEAPAVEEAPVAEEAPVEQADALLVTVGGVEIRQSQIDDKMKPQLKRMAAQGMDAKMIEQFKGRFTKQIVDALVVETLLDKEVKELNIVITEEDIDEQIRKMAQSQNPPISIDDFKALIEAAGQSFEEWKKNMDFQKGLGYQKLIESKIADKVNFTDEDAQKYYDENTTRFETPEQVRASHILIKPDTSDPNTDPNDAKAVAKAKTEELLRQIKEEGADFATLAKENSTCPSASDGGDLKFFSKGRMVPAFEQAAFGLKIGQISGVVETPFGYHIIKATDHKDASVTTFEDAKDGIIEMLTKQEQSRLAREYIESLKAQGNIVYPEAEKPAPVSGL